MKQGVTYLAVFVRTFIDINAFLTVKFNQHIYTSSSLNFSFKTQVLTLKQVFKSAWKNEDPTQITTNTKCHHPPSHTLALVDLYLKKSSEESCKPQLPCSAISKSILVLFENLPWFSADMFSRTGSALVSVMQNCSSKLTALLVKWPKRNSYFSQAPKLHFNSSSGQKHHWNLVFTAKTKQNQIKKNECRFKIILEILNKRVTSLTLLTGS